MNQSLKKTWLCYAVILLMAAVFVPFAYAVTTSIDNTGNGAVSGPGNGTGQGTNAGIALTLVSSSVADGAANVPLDPVIQLNFNKNVVNISVLDNNAQCFHLIDQSGAPVPIKLIFPDDQMQTTYKRNVFILPEANLQKNSQYELVVDSILRAKNGTGIDNAHTITFTTGAAATGEQNEILLKLGDNIIEYTNALAKTEYSVPHEQEVQKPSATPQPSAKQPMDVGRLSSLLLAAIAVVFVGASLFFILHKRKGKDQ